MSKCTKFQGVGTALVTPFTSDERLDRRALSHLIRQQIEAGVDFVVPCGTTGESPTLSPKEHGQVIDLVISFVKGRVPVLAGTGSNNTAEAVQYTKEAQNNGADGILAVSPYYNKPMKDGLLDYYRRIAKVGLPVILYDIPGRTAKGVPLDVILELAREGSIVGIKWASGDLVQLQDIIRGAPQDFTILSGDDNLTYTLMSLGGDGVISVLSNVSPATMITIVEHAENERWKEAREAHYESLDLMRAMFLETNPIPVKTALALMNPNIFEKKLRSPLTEMEKNTEQELIKTLKKYSLIS